MINFQYFVVGIIFVLIHYFRGHYFNDATSLRGLILGDLDEGSRICILGKVITRVESLI